MSNLNSRVASAHRQAGINNPLPLFEFLAAALKDPRIRHKTVQRAASLVGNGDSTAAALLKDERDMYGKYARRNGSFDRERYVLGMSRRTTHSGPLELYALSKLLKTTVVEHAFNMRTQGLAKIREFGGASDSKRIEVVRRCAKTRLTKAEAFLGRDFACLGSSTPFVYHILKFDASLVPPTNRRRGRVPKGCDAEGRNMITLENFSDMTPAELNKLVRIGKSHCYGAEGLYRLWQTAVDGGSRFTDPLNPSHLVTAAEKRRILAKLGKEAPVRTTTSLAQLGWTFSSSEHHWDEYPNRFNNSFVSVSIKKPNGENAFTVAFCLGVTHRNTGSLDTTPDTVVQGIRQVYDAGMDAYTKLVTTAFHDESTIWGYEEGYYPCDARPFPRTTYVRQVQQWSRYVRQALA